LLTQPTSDENHTWPRVRTMSSRTAGSKSGGKASDIVSAMTAPTSCWQRAAAGSVEARAMITASDKRASASIACVARRSTSMTRSARCSPFGGRACTRRPRSRTHSVSASASRWSFDEK
jgi:hypothetical protein